MTGDVRAGKHAGGLRTVDAEASIRRFPVVDKEVRCIGMIAQADIALRARAADVAKMLAEISRAVRAGREMRAARA
jgi:predicted transcriptional regulator